MNDDFIQPDKEITEHTHARILGLALINAGIKPLVRAEMADNPQFVRLIADLANNSFKYLMPGETSERVELVAAKPLTLDSRVAFLDMPFNVTLSLERAGYRTIRQIIFAHSSDLFALEHIGKVRIQQIRRILQAAGFDLRDDETSYWDLVKQVYGSVADSPVHTLFEGGVLRNNGKNRELLKSVDFIGELSFWPSKRINLFSGDPEQSGRQMLEVFLREHGLREEMDAQEEAEKAERFTLLSPPVE